MQSIACRKHNKERLFMYDRESKLKFKRKVQIICDGFPQFIFLKTPYLLRTPVTVNTFFMFS